MAIKTFTAGSVLTASDTNTFLANAGLVYVGGATLSGTTADIDNCFSSTYDNYVLVVNVTGATTGNTIFAQLRTGSGNESLNSYYWGGWFQQYGSTTFTAEGGTGATTSWRIGQAGTTGGAMTVQIWQPNLPVYTGYASTHLDWANYNRQHNGYKATTTQYTGIGLIYQGTGWAGSARVYGYRQA